MSEEKKLKDEELESVTGGVRRSMDGTEDPELTEDLVTQSNINEPVGIKTTGKIIWDA